MVTISCRDAGESMRCGTTPMWATKQRGSEYFYRSVRIDGKPVKLYVGRGSDAKDAAEMLERGKAARQRERAIRRAEALRFTAAAEGLHRFRAMLLLLIRAGLLLAGYHEHRGQWRRRR
jgi:hypothetical protein